MDCCLEPHPKFGGVSGLAIGITQESCEDWTALFRFELCDLVVEPVMSARDTTEEVI